MFSFIASNLLLTCLLYGATILDAASIDESMEGQCSQESVNNLLNGAKINNENDSELAEQLYERCSKEFLEDSKISPEVKQTVDTWLGKDLSQQDVADLLLSYELDALQNPKPEETSDKFKEDCEQMTEQYEAYRETSATISKHIHPDSDLLTSEMTTISGNQRELLNFAIYTQLCNFLLEEQD